MNFATHNHQPFSLISLTYQIDLFKNDWTHRWKQTHWRAFAGTKLQIRMLLIFSLIFSPIKFIKSNLFSKHKTPKISFSLNANDVNIENKRISLNLSPYMHRYEYIYERERSAEFAYSQCKRIKNCVNIMKKKKSEKTGKKSGQIWVFLSKSRHSGRQTFCPPERPKIRDWCGIVDIIKNVENPKF